MNPGQVEPPVKAGSGCKVVLGQRCEGSSAWGPLYTQPHSRSPRFLREHTEKEANPPLQSLPPGKSGISGHFMDTVTEVKKA